MSVELPSIYQNIIHLSRYSRYDEAKGRRETWKETVIDRLTTYLKYRVSKHTELNKEILDKIDEIVLSILNLDTMPSMRLLMTAGPACERDNVAAFNCSYAEMSGSGDVVKVLTPEMVELGFDSPITINMSKPICFDEGMYILLCGTGLGFSCERQIVSTLPVIGHKLSRKIYEPTDENFPGVSADELSIFNREENKIYVADSKYGWASALRILITELYNGNFQVSWDLSKVRKAGEPLKTFGGRASGPGPLQTLFNYCVSVFSQANGRKLTSIEVHGIVCKIAEVVVVGGVRRSALISLSNLSDDRMRHAKSGQWWEAHPEFALANNSVAYTEKPDVETYMREFTALIESKSGERGIFNRVSSQKQAARWGRRIYEERYGTNPCCFTGDMRLLTTSGYRTFEELAQLDNVNLINKLGNISLGKVWVSGEKEIVEVRFSRSKDNLPSIYCTPDHVFLTTNNEEVQAKDLKGCRLMPYFTIKTNYINEAFKAGFIQGDANTSRLDSSTHKGLEVYFSDKDIDIQNIFGSEKSTNYSKYNYDLAAKYGLSSNTLPTRGWPTNLPDEEVYDFLSGLYSANGCVILSGKRVSFKSTCIDLIKDIQEKLLDINIDSYITTNKEKDNKFSNGIYKCKESYDLNIIGFGNLKTFAKYIGFGQKYKRDALYTIILNSSPKISCVKYTGKTQEVYDYNEPETNWGIVEGFIVHNSEIILRPNQFCNLTEVIARENDNYETLKRKIEHATILGTIQSTLTDFVYLSKKWSDNTKEENLLGVSITGIMDNEILSREVKDIPREWYGAIEINYDTKLEGVLESLRDYSREVNKKWSTILGIKESTAITCVKPSGTVSQLVDSASGIHARHNPYYIRRIRMDKKDPMYKFLKEKGVTVEDDVMSPNNTAVFSFPMKAPEGAVCRKDRTALEQLELWLIYQRYWCEHKPSVTISVKDNEWPSVASWVWEHFDEVAGISFLPFSDHTYQQAPYEDITQEQYEDMLEKSISYIDFTEMHEGRDNTEGSQTLACVAGHCEI